MLSQEGSEAEPARAKTGQNEKTRGRSGSIGAGEREGSRFVVALNPTCARASDGPRSPTARRGRAAASVTRLRVWSLSRASDRACLRGRAWPRTSGQSRVGDRIAAEQDGCRRRREPAT